MKSKPLLSRRGQFVPVPLRGANITITSREEKGLAIGTYLGGLLATALFIYVLGVHLDVLLRLSTVSGLVLIIVFILACIIGGKFIGERFAACTRPNRRRR